MRLRSLFRPGQSTSWTRGLVAAAGALLLLASARDAAAKCLDGTNSQTVAANDGTALYLALYKDNVVPPVVPDSSGGGCTINVPAGTYNAPAGAWFKMPTGVTLKSVAGAATTTLTSTAGLAVIEVRPIIISGTATCPSGATIDGFTLEGPAGVWVGGNVAPNLGCTSQQVTGVTLKNLRVNMSNTTTSGDGITFSAVQSSLIDASVVGRAASNGINLGSGSGGNTVSNSTVQGTIGANGILINGSNTNNLTGNTINGTLGQSAVLVTGSTGATISGTTIGATAANGSGIYLTASSTGATISGTTITGSMQNGILADGSGSAVIQNNTALGGTMSQSVILIQNSSSSTVSGNTITATATTGAGINVSGSTGLTIGSNTVTVSSASGLAYGILLQLASNSASITSNTINASGAGKFSQSDILVQASTGATVRSNTITAPATLNGIYLATGGSAIVDGNQINATLANGILAQDSPNNAITSNTITGTIAQSAIQLLGTLALDGSVTTPVSGNFVGGNTIPSGAVIAQNGILLKGASNTMVVNNTVNGTLTQNAIAVQTSDDNVIAGNQLNVPQGGAFDGILLNSSVGIQGPGSNRNRIERNNITGHKTDAIVLTDGSLAN